MGWPLLPPCYADVYVLIVTEKVEYGWDFLPDDPW